MKKIIACLVTLVICTAVKAQSDKEPYLTKSLANENIQKVVAKTAGGSIEVTGTATGQYRLEVYIRPSINTSITKEEIQKRLNDDYELTIGVVNGQLNAISKHTGTYNWKKGLSISFKIFVPQNVSTDLNTSGGSISMANLNGSHDFSTSGGSLAIDKLTGMIHGRTSGGSISVSNSKNDIDLKTSGGSIGATNCSGNIKLNTSGGSLSLNNLEGTVEANTSGGSINGNTIKADLSAHTSGGSVNLQNFSGSVDASTSGGGMNVDIVKLGKAVTINNSGGNIDLRMPGSQGLSLNLHAHEIHVSALNNFSGSKDKDNIDGTLNGGGIPVKVHASSGSIFLAFK